jgi:hypothetical protein
MSGNLRRYFPSRIVPREGVHRHLSRHVDKHNPDAAETRPAPLASAATTPPTAAPRDRHRTRVICSRHRATAKAKEDVIQAESDQESMSNRLNDENSAIIIMRRLHEVTRLRYPASEDGTATEDPDSGVVASVGRYRPPAFAV